MMRSFVLSSVVAAVAACSLLAAPQASARALGSVSINTTGPRTPTPHDPWGGEQLCTAHLRRWDTRTGQWQYHMASGYSAATCFADAQIYINQGYSHNPNPGMGYCQCHSGFNGFMVSGPSGNGPIDSHNLTQEQVQLYDEGVQQLRQKYQLDQLAVEYEQLLQAIEALPAAPEGN